MQFSTLMYHEIREEKFLVPDKASPIKVKQNYEDNLPSPLFVTLENFKEQMKYLYDNNYHTLSIQEVLDFYYKGASIPEKSILLTFDDCYQAIKKYAYPILKEYNFKATAFVVTGWINSEKEAFVNEKSVCLTEEELFEMEDVFEYSNHSHHFHQRMNEKLSLMMASSEEELLKDLNTCNSYSIVRNKSVFAYPFGLFSNENVITLKNNRYKLAFTSAPGKNTKETNPLLLNRDVISYFMPMETFINKIK